jgi:hypothetical protein
MLVINEIGDAWVVEDADYDAIFEAVGGWIEGVPTAEGTVTMYCNEEGKLNGMAPNPAAEDLWAELMPTSWRVPGVAAYVRRALGVLNDGDTLVGPVAVFGPIDEDGETTDVPDELVARFTEGAR